MSVPNDQVNTVTWRPHVTVNNLNQSNLATTTSLKHDQPPSAPIGSSHNTAPKPFGQPGQFALVNKQYNSPINLFSNKNIAETIKAHSELLAPGVVGINFMKQDAPINKDSDVYKAILEEEATKNQKRSVGQFGNQYGVQAQSPAPSSAVSAAQSQQSNPADLSPAFRDDMPRTSPTLQSQSFKRLQHILGDDEPAATRHVDAPVGNPISSANPSAPNSLPQNQTIESNICSECGRLIVGIFCKIKDRKLHEECFRCSTCGNSLKNQGYFNINEKLYCEIHAQQAAQSSHSPNRIITPNCTTIRSKDPSKPTSPAFQIPIKPAASSAPWTDASPILSPKINLQQSNANPINYSTNQSSTIKNYNTSLYQSAPHPYPGPSAGTNLNTYNKQTTTISAPKFSWPQQQQPNNKQSMQTTETVKTSYSTGPGSVVNKTVTTNYSTNTYNDSQQLQSISNNFQDTLKLNDSSFKIPQLPQTKIPPSTLPKPILTNNQWQTQNTTQFKSTQSNLSGTGQTSFTGSRQAPRRGRGQLRSQETGSSRIPICSNLSCCQQIRGPFISALGKTWCPEHFVCSHPSCRRSLQDCGFVEERNTLYCETCFELHFAPTCYKCNQRIKGDCLIAIDRQYHPECFTCHHCKRIFANTSFYLEDGLPYCEKDWNDLFTTKCVACHYPIEAGDRWVEALNNNYHSQCFKCTLCNRTLEGQSFYAKGGRPYCKNH